MDKNRWPSDHITHIKRLNHNFQCSFKGHCPLVLISRKNLPISDLIPVLSDNGDESAVALKGFKVIIDLLNPFRQLITLQMQYITSRTVLDLLRVKSSW